MSWLLYDFFNINTGFHIHYFWICFQWALHIFKIENKEMLLTLGINLSINSSKEIHSHICLHNIESCHWKSPQLTYTQRNLFIFLRKWWKSWIEGPYPKTDPFTMKCGFQQTKGMIWQDEFRTHLKSCTYLLLLDLKCASIKLAT